MKITFTVCLFLFFAFNLSAQYYDLFNCKVAVEGIELKYPFTGGFDAPQFSDFDINGDGLMDIYVFDRSGSVSSVFIRNMNNEKYPFNYSKQFNNYLPKTLEGFSTLKDYNHDGIVDVFSSSISLGAAGIMLFEGTENGNDILFKTRRMGRPQGNPDILWNNLPAGQVYNAATDIPAIVDVDGDGDLDVLTFDEAGSYVYFCRNYQIEKGLPLDTMDFTIEDYCFGKFQEGGLSQVINLSSDPNLCANKFTQDDEDNSKSGGAHSGSTVMAFDPDLDSDMDLILGDLTYNGLVFLENGGDRNNGFITSIDNSFPSYDHPVDMPVFLAGFSLDINDDGMQDVVVSPNGQSSIQNKNNIWYYENTGDSNKLFSLKQMDLFTEETLDFGSYSVPAFVDYNADGLMDIIIGSGGFFDGNIAELQLILLENTGTQNLPSYDLVDADYLNFSQFSTTSLNPSPCFGDLDSDGDLDMIIGDEAGKLYYFENRASGSETFNFAAPVYNWMNISSGQRIRPQIFDYNKDGLNDIIIGERNTNGINDPDTGDFITGNLNYYQNQGTASEPFFNPDIEALPNYPALGKIKVSFSVSSSAKGGASPYFFNLNDNTFLLVGSISGRISLYEIDSNDPKKEAILLDDRLGGLVEGAWTAPAIFDIDNDNIFEILIGNSRGGLSFFKTDLMHSSSVSIHDIKSNLTVFPNPADKWISIKLDNHDLIEKIDLIDMQGRLVSQWRNETELNISKIETGIYLMRIYDSKNNFYLKKIMIK